MAKGRYEGSPADKREDVRGAKRVGTSLKAYERSAADKREDARGQAKLNKTRRKK